MRTLLSMAVCLIVGLAGVSRGQDLPKPTKEHKMLRKDVGTWDVTVKLWMDPKGEPSESKATEVNRLLPGGLWVTSEFKSDLGGQPFHGRGVTGYDIHKKKFVGTWVDSMTTSLMVMEGTYDEASKSFTFTGDTLDESGKPLQIKEVVTVTGEDTKTATMSMKSEKTGPDFVKMMEFSYKKRPKAAAAAKKKAG